MQAVQRAIVKPKADAVATGITAGAVAAKGLTQCKS